jgi:hypothetical protein
MIHRSASKIPIFDVKENYAAHANSIENIKYQGEQKEVGLLDICEE